MVFSSTDERHHELGVPATRRAAPPDLALETGSARTGEAASAPEHGIRPLGAPRATGPDPKERVFPDAEREHLEARDAGPLRPEGRLSA
jgi:hypothetical protein